jgi:rhomboid protease GluP
MNPSTHIWTRIRENWLTRKPDARALNVALFFGFVLFAASAAFFIGYHNLDQLMAASPKQVFAQHQLWRAWTALFAHANLEHLLGNSILFIPLTYLLAGYFGLFSLPLLGIALGGIVNLFVLKAMPEETSLLGMSGVVYWMGAVWLTLYVLIDRRERFRRRFAYALFLSLFVFVPEKYKPEVSYMSHFLGFAVGVASGLAVYIFFKKRFLAAEVTEVIVEDDLVLNDSLSALAVGVSYQPTENLSHVGRYPCPSCS